MVIGPHDRGMLIVLKKVPLTVAQTLRIRQSVTTSRRKPVPQDRSYDKK